MERLQELISQLKEQYERHADPSQMLLTARLLEAELISLTGETTINRGSAKVAVMMPSSVKMYVGQPPSPEIRTFNGTMSTPYAKIVPEPANIPEIKAGSQELNDQDLNAQELKTAAATLNGPGERTLTETRSTVRPASNGKDPQRTATLSYDPLTDLPTLAHQQTPRELNDLIGNNGTSLNDKLKTDVMELAAALNDIPVKDLKKAIGVNDRFVFISQLFRGDEVMYERSIKTINGFRILPEAEYWMERELKVKLGWDENREATRHFYQLVRRRFS